MAILQVKNVTKRFGEYKASNDISFQVQQGKIFGLLGPNGAGKTTMIRMITNIYIPDEGEILLFDEKLKSEHQNKIGYLPEERGLYKKMKVIDQLRYFGQIKGLSHKEAEDAARKWLIKLDATDFVNKKVQDLSKGMQQKVQFISTIMHEPDLLILDEPFSGFDPINAELLKQIILDMKEKGKTIILSTHVMHQVEQMCDEIVLINKGNAVLKGNVRQIKQSYGKNTIVFEFEGNLDFIKEITGVEILNSTQNRIEFKVENAKEKAHSILEKAVQNANISKFEIVEPSVNDIFIDVVGKDKAGVA